MRIIQGLGLGLTFSARCVHAAALYTSTDANILIFVGVAGLLAILIGLFIRYTLAARGIPCTIRIRRTKERRDGPSAPVLSPQTPVVNPPSTSALMPMRAPDAPANRLSISLFPASVEHQRATIVQPTISPDGCRSSTANLPTAGYLLGQATDLKNHQPSIAAPSSIVGNYGLPDVHARSSSSTLQVSHDGRDGDTLPRNQEFHIRELPSTATKFGSRIWIKSSIARYPVSGKSTLSGKQISSSSAIRAFFRIWLVLCTQISTAAIPFATTFYIVDHITIASGF
ncbi:hypothetical protein BJ138DRAFT_1182434 [Hygrophoropsis aurantiaca]|uniref:Uncharacterized protein n=1 Tax=Hygrophoropsis aurantiaca TaxID=72124 RepID=A0ACB8A1U4_9AGAM|nr:hypothetical protein BJ138DRAFT_1182434 [Hygrophoropsis aurantiaca]